ncbi:hypothetical protein KY285_028868 [Solanum tuberosum]|nr:hypothetical protein KY289_029057 [Solanum tuberosum]KAH0667662.1 hypothetical protein KY285_028868 [Solanum tuberosum]KAH0673696.1 hypothetical protein KY284_024783 [Solanum tuberosum]
MESTSLDLQHSKKSTDSTFPINSNQEAIFVRVAKESPETRLQFRATSSQVRKDSTSGDYSPHDEVHLTEISSKMDGGITGEENSSENQTPTTGVYEKIGNVNQSPLLDTHLPDISSNLDEGNTNNNQYIQPAESGMNLNKGAN